ncbi:MAG: A/G-specific adenine glycosylase [Microgenomates bacterium OLB22]|nr:MAG: A/G-specific adenine glycosylase [Microgenomates bacterium OLB22]
MPSPDLHTIDIHRFQKQIYDYFRSHGRVFPWRYESDPYKVLVSEVMLQQTQTGRVVAYYERFIHAFPTVKALADAPLSKVLSLWQGLGYNRRGMYLHKAAQMISKDYDGKVPLTVSELDNLPGIGYATAAAIYTYAYDRPTPFIETNIRAVYLYFFYEGEEEVTDESLLRDVQISLDYDHPRDWFYALTDYGVMLKKEKKFRNLQSKHYTCQSRFEGSIRQVRGVLLREALQRKHISEQFALSLGYDKMKTYDALATLVRDGILGSAKGTYYIVEGGE